MDLINFYMTRIDIIQGGFILINIIIRHQTEVNVLQETPEA